MPAAEAPKSANKPFAFVTSTNSAPVLAKEAPAAFSWVKDTQEKRAVESEDSSDDYGDEAVNTFNQQQNHH